MPFQKISDKKRALYRRLDNLSKNEKISHAYIFEGDNNSEKEAIALYFVKNILCKSVAEGNCGECIQCRKVDEGNHEDVMVLGKGQDSVKDSDIIEMQKKIKTKPFGERNIVIIFCCDNMTVRAQNRVLKTLEEPPGDTVIILLSENMENLTTTIRSRCVKYRIENFGDREIDAECSKTVDEIIARKPFYILSRHSEKFIKDTERLNIFLDALQTRLRNIILNGTQTGFSDNEIYNLVHEVEAVRREIKSGVSATYALKKMFVKIGGNK